MDFINLTAPLTGSELVVDMDKVDAMHRSREYPHTMLHGINLFVQETPAEIVKKLMDAKAAAKVAA